MRPARQESYQGYLVTLPASVYSPRIKPRTPIYAPPISERDIAQCNALTDDNPSTRPASTSPLVDAAGMVFQKVITPKGLAFTAPLLMAACVQADASTSTQLDTDNPPGPERSLEPPFPSGFPNIRVQQGYSDKDADGNLHRAIDFINGTLDRPETWEKFPVTAAADGNACKNPPDRQGDAIFIVHPQNTQAATTYYGHIEDPLPTIPDCSTGKTLKVTKKTLIAYAGKSGTSATHLHFGVKDKTAQPLDPFDMYAVREVYPNLNSTTPNTRYCGPLTLFTACQTTDESPQAQATPAAEKKTETQWSRFTSQVARYEINYPLNWEITKEENPGYSIARFVGPVTGEMPTIVTILIEPGINEANDFFAAYSKRLGEDLKQTPHSETFSFPGVKDARKFRGTAPKGAIPAGDFVTPGKASPEFEMVSVAFVTQGKGWQVNLLADKSVIKKHEDTTLQGMLDSLRFLPSEGIPQAKPATTMPQVESPPKKAIPDVSTSPIPDKNRVTQWYEFTSREAGYEINRPFNWAPHREDAGGYHLGRFVGPITGEMPTIISIVAEPTNKSTFQYGADLSHQIRMKAKGPPGGNTVSFGSVKDAIRTYATMPRGAIPAGQFVVQGKASPEYDSISIAFTRNGKGYQISLLADKSIIKQHETTTFQDMLNSFRFLSPETTPADKPASAPTPPKPIPNA